MRGLRWRKVRPPRWAQAVAMHPEFHCEGDLADFDVAKLLGEPSAATNANQDQR